MLNENARDVVGYEGLYAVTEDGRVYSHSRVINTCHGATRLMKGRWLKPSLQGSGYLFVTLCRDGDLKQFTIHRIVANSFIEKVAGKTFINHKDSDKTNNNASNLEWCTQKENMMHCSNSGRIKIPRHSGDSHPMSKLNKESVKYIRSSEGLTVRELANKYNVTVQTIHGVLKGRVWRGV